ncbi:MAG: hypothetical protein IIA70_05155 [Proteobacteria bacterium]|nr:hypothetical protein [Pseudomonadota bacterium]
MVHRIRLITGLVLFVYLVVRGRTGTICAYVIEDAQSLPALAQTAVS